MDLDPEAWEVPDSVKCGNRRDLPKKQRRHQFEDAGRYWRTNPMTPGFKYEADIAICRRCGVEKVVYHERVTGRATAP